MAAANGDRGGGPYVSGEISSGAGWFTRDTLLQPWFRGPHVRCKIHGTLKLTHVVIFLRISAY